MDVQGSDLREFRVLRALGAGSTSRVLEALHVPSQALVAIKVLEPSTDSHELRQRLSREAVLLSSLRSPYVGRVLGYGVNDERPFLVLELLRGETLGDYLHRGARLASAELADWIGQLLMGVRDCHAANLVHRDIKPPNVFLCRSIAGEPVPAPPPAPPPPMRIKLIDFGVARLNEIASLGNGLTSSHHLIGSMGYMAPEQLKSARVGPRADLYAVGVVIFRCIAGRLPFVSRSFEALIRSKLDDEAPRLSMMSGVRSSHPLDVFVARALERDPEHRFGSATEMLDAWWRVAESFGADPQGLYDDEDGPITEGPGSFETDKTLAEQELCTLAEAHDPTDEEPTVFRVKS